MGETRDRLLLAGLRHGDKRHELVIVPTTLRYPYEEKADMVRPEEGRF